MKVVSRAVGPRRPPSPRRMHRQRGRWPLLLALAPLAGWAAYQLLDRPDPTTALGREAGPIVVEPTSTIVAFEAPSGARTTAARCWMVVIDESASMASADASGARADAVRAMAEFLADHGLDGDRIGVTWFADRADVQEPAQAVSAAPRPGPSQSVGSGTKIAAALDASLAAMERVCADTERVAVLVSDGQATSAGDFGEIAELFAAGDVGLHLIAMNADGTYDSVRSFWEDDALGMRSIREIDRFGDDEVAAAVAAILSAETGQQVTAR